MTVGDPSDGEPTKVTRPEKTVASDEASITDRHTAPPLDAPTVRVDFASKPVSGPKVITVREQEPAQIDDIEDSVVDDDDDEDPTVGIAAIDPAMAVRKAEPTDPSARMPTSPGDLAGTTNPQGTLPDMTQDEPVRPVSLPGAAREDTPLPQSDPTATMLGDDPQGRFASTPEATLAEDVPPRQNSIFNRIGTPADSDETAEPVKQRSKVSARGPTSAPPKPAPKKQSGGMWVLALAMSFAALLLVAAVLYLTR